MKRVGALAIAALLACIADSGHAQNVYKCEEDGQTVFSQQPCAEDAEKMELTEAYSPDGSRQNTGIDFRRTTCRTRDTGTTEAIVELANMTDSIKSGELRIQFVRAGGIMEVANETFLLGPWGSETFSRFGPIGSPVDNCEYRITVSQ